MFNYDLLTYIDLVEEKSQRTQAETKTKILNKKQFTK